MWLHWTFSWHFVITMKNVKHTDETSQNIVGYNPDSHFRSISKSYSECDRYESVTCLYAEQKETYITSESGLTWSSCAMIVFKSSIYTDCKHNNLIF